MADSISEAGKRVLRDAKITDGVLREMTESDLNELTDLSVGDTIILRINYPNLRSSAGDLRVCTPKLRKSPAAQKEGSKKKVKTANNGAPIQVSEDNAKQIVVEWLVKRKNGVYELVPDNLGGGERLVEFTGNETHQDLVNRGKELYFEEFQSPMGSSYSFFHTVYVNGMVFPEMTLNQYLKKKSFKDIPKFYFSSAENVDEALIYDYTPEETQKKMKGRGKKLLATSTVVTAPTRTTTTTATSATSATSTCVSSSDKVFTFNRSNVYEEIIKKMDQIDDIFSEEAAIRFQSPDGSYEKGAGNGTKRELLTLFFERVYERLCYGKTFYLFNKADTIIMESVTKVIEISYRKWFLLPIKLCQSFLQFILFSYVDAELILKDFLAIIPENDKKTFLKAKELMAEGNFQILFCIRKYSEREMKNSQILIELRDNYETFITEIAEYNVLHKNEDWVRIMKAGLSFVTDNCSIAELMLMYSENSPTAANIIARLDIKDKECNVYINLCRFLLDYEEEYSEKFLFEVTSSSILSEQGIKIDFYDDDEQLGKINLGTCGSHVAFPVQFEDVSYDDFKMAIIAFCDAPKKFNTY